MTEEFGICRGSKTARPIFPGMERVAARVKHAIV
jgi:hypothetical protein